MNSNDDHKLEFEIDALLKDLPDAIAPADLIERTMSRIDAAPQLPWYRQPWPAWPTPWRFASLTLMGACVLAMAIACLPLFHAEILTSISRRFSDQFVGANVLWSTLGALLNAGLVVVQKMNTVVAIWCISAATTAYLLCIGLGTLFARYTFARR